MAVVLEPIVYDTIGTGSISKSPTLFNPSNDWAVFDGLQSADLYIRQAGGLYSTLNIPNCLLRITTDEEAQTSDGVYLRFTGTWYLPAQYITDDIYIKPGDFVRDSTGDWVAQKVDNPFMGSTWELFCDHLTFNLPLSDTINYYTVTPSVDSYGGRVLDQTLLYEDLTCAIQPIIDSEDLKADRIDKRLTGFIYINEEIIARTGDLIEDTTGTSSDYYEIISVENRSRIDEFTKLSVRQILSADELGA